jgi:hypothetical protein
MSFGGECNFNAIQILKWGSQFLVPVISCFSRELIEMISQFAPPLPQFFGQATAPRFRDPSYLFINQKHATWVEVCSQV